ncbi:bacterioferritin [Pseudobacteriovorax antillogorgiicola]|uniref:Bacterioferritin n=1 Tax=Pseudobacteriovorax antillogorgiicola TaxID=1513793 RepID=A0A1Y6BEZ7_9BACT|nr:bacterioferritin [Pseudobacteriovorax antillogorgiicola]TCS58521.1 bacterioferritin [Pseudobacteriovorax antillogorgiicola]SME98011.1 bacterioferritin [Pseudobacteriovorax antillogorgiicola]
MKGHPDIIAALNDLLTSELTSIDIYFVQSKILRNMGYNKLYEQLNHEMEDEQGHATRVIERIIFLEGTPDVSKREPFTVDTDVKTMFENDLKYEHVVRDKLIKIIDLCFKHHDYVTKEAVEPLLQDTEEDHIDWLETQLSVIDEIGIKNYLAEKL